MKYLMIIHLLLFTRRTTNGKAQYYIASFKHEGGGGGGVGRIRDSASQVCIAFENSPNSPSIQMRQYKHGKKVLYCFYKICLKLTRQMKEICLFIS